MNTIVLLVILAVFAVAGYVLTKTSKKKTQSPQSGGQPEDTSGQGTGPIADQ